MFYVSDTISNTIIIHLCVISFFRYEIKYTLTLFLGLLRYAVRAGAYLVSGKLISVESKTRVRTPTFQFLSPKHFITVFASCLGQHLNKRGLDTRNSCLSNIFAETV